MKENNKEDTTGYCGKCGAQVKIPINERFPTECPECKRKTVWKGNEEATKDVDSLYEDGNGSPIPMRIARYIMRKHVFRALPNARIIYVYGDGYYRNDGVDVIHKDVQDILGDESKRYWRNEVVGCIETELMINDMDDDKNAHLVNLKNGLFNIETMELDPHTPEKFIRSQLPIEYDPDADCPEIRKFISEVVYECDVPIIQEMFGYCLYRSYPYQHAFMLIGGGANGKSTLLSILQSVLGIENISSVELHELDQRFTKAHLMDKLANISLDIPGKKMRRTSIFKKLTGGDLIDAEIKFKGWVQFVNYAKLIFSANKVPDVVDKSVAFFRRWAQIPFPNTFEGDNKIPQNELLAKLTTPKELSGLFNWMIEGLKRMMENGDISRSESADEIRDRYMRNANPIYAFVKDCTEESADGWIEKDELYNEYCAYCREYKLPITPKNIFSKDLPMHIRTKATRHTIHRNGKKKRIGAWDGIVLKAGYKEKHINNEKGKVYKLQKKGESIYIRDKRKNI